MPMLVAHIYRTLLDITMVAPNGSIPQPKRSKAWELNGSVADPMEEVIAQAGRSPVRRRSVRKRCKKGRVSSALRSVREVGHESE